MLMRSSNRPWRRAWNIPITDHLIGRSISHTAPGPLEELGDRHQPLSSSRERSGKPREHELDRRLVIGTATILDQTTLDPSRDTFAGTFTVEGGKVNP